MISLPPATYDPEARCIAGPSASYRLSRSEHALLMCLEHRRGKMVTRDSLIGALWEPDLEPEYSLESLRVHLWRLRKKLADCGAVGVIQNVWGDGYLLADVATPLIVS